MTLHRGQNKSRNLNFALYDPSQDSSVGSILAWYPGGPGFISQQGQKFFNENNQYMKAAHRGPTCERL